MKKNIFKTAVSWFKRDSEESVDEAHASAQPEPNAPSPPVTSIPPIPQPPRSEPPPPAPKIKRTLPPPEPEPVPTVLSVTEGPELKLTKRGAGTYAICPHCESTWNVRERLHVVSFKKVEKKLTCPSCNQPVSLPSSLDIRKLQ